MIIALLGGTGSGKTVYAVKLAKERKNNALTNFKLFNTQHKRLKKNDCVIEQGKDYIINADFWNKQKNVDVFLDEIHNIVHSRRAMTKQNIAMSKWVSQIRKMLDDKEKNNLYIISQTLRRIDVDFRELLHEIHYCKKFSTNELMTTTVREFGKKTTKPMQKVFINVKVFKGEQVIENYLAFREANLKTYAHQSYFLANPYFEFYDSYEILVESEFL